MKRILALLAAGFSSSSEKTKEFTDFARRFKIAFENEIDRANGTLVSYTVGHFFVSGFLRLPKGQLIYFSLPDVRHWLHNRPDTYYGSMQWRTVENVKDYSGGKNRRIPLHDGMVEAMREQLFMDDNSISFLIIGENKRVNSSGTVYTLR